MTKGVLYVQPESCVMTERDIIVVRHPDADQTTALVQVQAIFAFGKVEIEPYALQTLLQQQIPVSFFDRNGRFTGRLEPAQIKKAGLIRAQALMTQQQRLHLMRQMVWASLHQRRRFLKRGQREHAIEVRSSIQAIEFALEPLKARYPKLHPQTVESCRGLQGSGMKAYWEGFGLLLRIPGFEFTGRRQESRVNQMLDFTYRLLHQSCWNAIAAVGLDPWLPIFHGDHAHQPAPPLALDLATEFKIYADASVVRSINRGQIALKDFDGAEALPTRACGVLTQEFQRKLSETITHPAMNQRCTYQEAIYFQAVYIRDFLLGAIDHYPPLLLR